MSTPTSAAPTAPGATGPLPQGEAKVAAVRAMFDTIAPRYDLVNRLMTFRMDVGWRQRAVSALGLVPGELVADLACGTGDLCFELDRKGLVPIGFDLSFGMLAHAPKPFPRAQADVLQLPLADGSIDGVTCGFALRNFVELDGFFEELARVVRPGGRIALLDVAQPPNPLLRAGHSIYFGKVVPLVGGLLSDKDAYAYLPRSVAYLPDPDEILAMLVRSGFSDARRSLFSVGISQLFSATRDRD
ncbi:MAG: ubiquinone/menaquinone biosynthesis methyltransferase [Acidimicrobiales bacterium]